MSEDAWPTGKNTISYSEVSTWNTCAWKHKLSYIDKIQTEQNWIHARFGTVLHNCVEHFLKTNTLDITSSLKELKNVWKEEGYDDYEKWAGWLEVCMADFPQWIASEFPEYEVIDLEMRLNEDIPEEDLVKFKGFIDCILKVPLNKEKTKWKIWIIDWKTGPAYGWIRSKREDKNVLSQLYLYKSYVMQKFGYTSREVGTAFVIFKKGAKPGKSIDRFNVSAGPKSLESANKMVKRMLSSVRQKKFFKNKYNCRWCEFADTEHCIR